MILTRDLFQYKDGISRYGISLIKIWHESLFFIMVNPTTFNISLYWNEPQDFFTYHFTIMECALILAYSLEPAPHQLIWHGKLWIDCFKEFKEHTTPCKMLIMLRTLLWFWVWLKAFSNEGVLIKPETSKFQVCIMVENMVSCGEKKGSMYTYLLVLHTQMVNWMRPCDAFFDISFETPKLFHIWKCQENVLSGPKRVKQKPSTTGELPPAIQTKLYLLCCAL